MFGSSALVSWWLTMLLHRFPAETPFETQMRLNQFDYLQSSEHAQASLAEQYVGLPFEPWLAAAIKGPLTNVGRKVPWDGRKTGYAWASSAANIRCIRSCRRKHPNEDGYRP